MRFTAEASDLRRTVERARRAMVTSPALLAYTGMLLAVDRGHLLATGSDGETTLTAKLKVDVSQDGSALLRPGPLSAYLAKVPPGPVTVVSEADTDVVVTAGTSLTYRFRQLSASFPTPSFDRHNLVPAELDGFGDALASARHAAAEVVQLRSDEEDIVLSTTDRYRIAHVTLSGRGFGEFNGVVPLAGLEQLARETIDEIGIDSSRRQLRARGPAVFVSLRLADEPFPDISAIVEAETTGSAVVPRRPFIEALDRLASVAGTSSVRLELAHGTMRCSATNLELGSGHETIPVQGDGDFVCLASPSFLREAAAAHQADEMTFGWTGALAPLYLRSSGELAVTTVVMPVRA